MSLKQNGVMLIIMDGWGISEDKSVSAIDQNNTPFYHNAILKFPNSTLEASGTAVGLPQGQMGNSEVGHMNLGAGRTVYQDLEKIQIAIDSGEFEQTESFQKLIQYCVSNHKPLHLMGLLSDGGVHSSISHLKSILKVLHKYELPQIYLHCFMDGRDTDPRSGLSFIHEINETLEETGGKIISVVGRYYAMDRDKRWARVQRAYNLLVHGKGKEYNSAEEAVSHFYEQGITDEFMEPCVILDNGHKTKIEEHDAVLFFNFRTDRGRELTQVLTQFDLPDFNMQKHDFQFVTLTQYDPTYVGISTIFSKNEVVNTLGEILEKNNKKQIRIAETEKYPHVTFFFNGGREKPFPGEERILCPSPAVATYDLQPEMSAQEIKDKIIPRIKSKEPDFICLNFANPDMVGHTGVFEAAVKACAFVDKCVSELVSLCQETGYIVIILADHGNSDKMKNPDGTPHTAHTTALVPCILINPHDHNMGIDSGKLGDIAPTILKLMNLPIPSEMTGKVLV